LSRALECLNPARSRTNKQEANVNPVAPDTATLDDLRGTVGGEVIGPDDEGYDEHRKVFNGMIDRRPAVIARCASRDDVVAALAFRAEHDLPVAIRCGGHSTPGYSCVDAGVVVDVSPMKAVDVDVDAKTARVGAGLTWGELDAATQEHGLAVTGGRVSDTGVTGLTLGSGSGWLERMYGITCQSLVGAEVVLADGRIERAAEDENSDLLWALRGGGGNFGVVTELEFQLHPIPEAMFAGILLWPRERGGEVMRAYRDFMERAPDEVGGGLALISFPPAPFVPEELQLQPACGVLFIYVGPPEEGEKAVAPLRELDPAVEALGPMPYTAFNSIIDAGAPKGIHEYFRIDWLRELSDEAIDTAISERGKSPSPLTQVIFEPLGGAMNRLDRESMALNIPDARWAYHCLSLWPPDPSQDEANVAWAKNFSAAMHPFSLGTAYPNFIAADEGEGRLVASYGPEKFARLQEIKATYDPDNVFRLNQNIKPPA
jgi:FAD/FMN-containing dehydrogenase